MRYLDANVFVRMLTQDEPAMTDSALRLFQRIRDGGVQARVLDATIAEVVYVLSSPNIYNLPRDEVRHHLQPLLSLSGLVLQNRARLLMALNLYTSNRSLNFADALVAAAALEESPAEMYSFDRGFDRVEGVVRVEP
jgi:predicted nucleic acid-binding protein